MTRAWETAVQYQFWHVLALMVLTALPLPALRVAWVALFWAVGMALFSGSLYALALDGPRWLGPVTPLGGLAFIIGWLLLAYASCARRIPDQQTAHGKP